MRAVCIRRLIAALAMVTALSGCGLTAPRSSAGFADLDALSWRDVDTEVNLSFGPSLLRFAANRVEDDPATRELLRSLEGVRVKVYRIEGDALEVAGDLDAMSVHLREQGWEESVRVQEGGETTHVLVMVDCDHILGITVLSSDAEEAVIVNVMGNLDPADFTRAMRALQAPGADIDITGPAVTET